MKEITMTTKQLREQMAEAVAALEDGMSIRLTYRRRPIGVILPADAMPERLGDRLTSLRDQDIE